MITVNPLPDVARDGWVRRGARVEGLPDGAAELWFDFEPQRAPALSERADPWVLALVFAAMERRTTLSVNGDVSRELLAGLETFQSVWSMWAPDRYRPVSIVATREVEPAIRPASPAGPAVMAFGGGLDSCYSAWKHTRLPSRRLAVDLIAGVMVAGLDGPASEVPDSTAIDDARALLADLGLDLWTMRTNARRFASSWDHAYGVVLASCLHWFGGAAALGLLPGSVTFSTAQTRCGSHPLTDPLLGSDRMRIVHDGAERDFLGKAAIVAAWPEAARRLRAGSSPKRTLASLALAVAGPAGSSSDTQVAGDAHLAGSGPSIVLRNERDVRDATAILAAAEKTGRSSAAWYQPLRECLGRATGNPESARPSPAARRPRPGAYWPAPPPVVPEIHAFPEEPATADGQTVLAARIEGLGDTPKRLWFSVDSRHAPSLSSLADPFLCALQFPAMRTGADLVIHGPVSRVLLRNLEEYQEVWHAWAPEHVAPVRMRADVEVEAEVRSADALVLFSGGADSAFTLYRHHRGLVGRRTRRIAAALMVHGFDILPAEVTEYRRAFENSRRMVESLGIDLWSMSTNFRDVVAEWEPGHGTAIAACAHCFAGRVGTALVASTAPFNNFSRPWGTHNLTDRMLGGDRLRVETDGADVDGRLEKARLLAEWPGAMRGLRVCFQSPRRDRNCGECRKCMMTALAFLANGLPLPSTLRRPAPRLLRRLPLEAAWELRSFDKIFTSAQAAGVSSQGWYAALEECVRWNQERWAHPDHDEPPPPPPLWWRARRKLSRILSRVRPTA